MSSDFNEKLRRAAITDPLLNQAEVCEALRLSKSSLARMRKAGTGPVWVRVGGSIRYRKSALDVMTVVRGAARP